MFDPLKELQSLTCEFGFQENGATLKIYDRYGEVLFEATPYQPWNGRDPITDLILSQRPICVVHYL